MSGNPDSQLRIIFDSDVMFDPFRRYMLLSLVLGGAFQTVWSAELIREWSYVIVREGRTTLVQADKQRDKLSTDFSNALIEVPDEVRQAAQSFVRDPNDQHVAACALAVAPCVLLTYNRRHFHVEALRERSVDLHKPDQWLAEAFRRAPSEIKRDWIAALEGHRNSMRSPPFTLGDYLARAASRDLNSFVSALGEFLPAIS